MKIKSFFKALPLALMALAVGQSADAAVVGSQVTYEGLSCTINAASTDRITGRVTTSLTVDAPRDGITYSGDMFINTRYEDPMTRDVILITEIGAYAFSDNNTLTSLTIQGTGLTTIKHHAFAGAAALKSLYIPSSVTTIEDWAFSSMPSLERIAIGSSDPSRITVSSYSFRYSDQRRAVLYVPGTGVSKYAAAPVWKEFTNIQELPAANSKFVYDGFRYMMLSGNTNMGGTAKLLGSIDQCEGDITIPSTVELWPYTLNVTTIAPFAFDMCTDMTSLTLPETISEFGTSCFSGCTSLTSVNIPESVTVLPQMTFYHCESLVDFTIPEQITTIGGSAFEGCTALEELRIAGDPAAITLDGTNQFDGTYTASLWVPASLDYCRTTAPWKNFSEIIGQGELGQKFEFEGLWYEIITVAPRMTAKVIPTQSTAYSGALAAYPGQLGIPSTVEYKDEIYHVTTIGRDAFRNNQNITKVYINEGIETIEPYAFYYCQKLLRIFLPSTVKSLGRYSLGSLSGLTLMSCMNPDPSSIALEDKYSVFLSLPSITLLVPNGSTDSYQSSDWNEFFSEIRVPTANHFKNLYPYYVNGLIVWASSETECTVFGYDKSFSTRKIYDIPETLNILGSERTVTKLRMSAFFENKNITTVKIPQTVAEISASAFGSCSALSSVELSEGLTTIGNEAFQRTAIESINIPASVTEIGSRAFCEAPNLSTITVDEANENYCAVDNVLFDKEMTTLIQYPLNSEAESYEVPASVKKILLAGISHSYNLTTLRVHAKYPKLLTFERSYNTNVLHKTLIVPARSLEAFKKDDNFKFFDAILPDEVVGDITGKGIADITDAQLVINSMLGSSDDLAIDCDVNGDAFVDIADAQTIINSMLGADVNVNWHHYVDLGLPSGTLWSKYNVGAASIDDPGDHFAWGETAPSEIYDEDSCYSSRFTMEELYFADVIDNEINGVLTPEYDAATANWGEEWCMPTAEQIAELNEYCESEWAEVNGAPGRLLTGPNGQKLFLPAAGVKSATWHVFPEMVGFWSSTPNDDTDNAYIAISFEDTTDGEILSMAWGRFGGLTVRPVKRR